MSEAPQFEAFNKIPRFSREVIITEKLDGTNAQILITEDGDIFTGSRNRWITPGKSTDNYGFAGWVLGHKDLILQLGPGRHYGEWWGQGIQRGYNLKEKRFTLFNVDRYTKNPPPECCSVVPVIVKSDRVQHAIDDGIAYLSTYGSVAVPGYMDPEGIVIFHTASGHLYKKTCKDDEKPKTL
jgi:hypothetical protein